MNAPPWGRESMRDKKARDDELPLKGSGENGQSKDPFLPLLEMVCRNYCRYFKGKGGETDCGGYWAVFNLVTSGVLTVGELREALPRQPAPPEMLEMLREKLCKRCGYFEDACDFQSPSPPEGAVPCGGYRVLQVLLDCGKITETELENILLV